MSQNNRVSFQADDIPTPRRRRLPPHQVWFCGECGIGPLNVNVDAGCANCGHRWDHSCRKEWLAGAEIVSDISPRDEKEPHCHEAPPMLASNGDGHVLHSHAQGAATPFDYTGSTVGDTELGTSRQLPFPPHQSHSKGTGAVAQPKVLVQQSDNIVLWPWNLVGYGNNTDSLPISESFLNQLSSGMTAGITRAASHNDTRSTSTSHSSQEAVVSHQFESHLLELHEPGSLSTVQDVYETVLGIGALHTLQSDLAGCTAGVNPNCVTTNDEPIELGRLNTSTLFEPLPTLPFALPISSGKAVAPSGEHIEWWNLPTDSADEFFTDIQIQSGDSSGGPSPLLLTRILDINDCIIPPHPQSSSVVDSSNAESLSSTGSLQDGRGANKVALGCPKCCLLSGNERLACLFYKYDPRLHIECMNKTFDTIGHLRQHLDKYHQLGPNHCGVCWKKFPTGALLADHKVQRRCQSTGGVSVNNLPPFPRIMKWTREKKWCWGWRKLFGNNNEPPPCPFPHPLEDLEAQLCLAAASGSSISSSFSSLSSFMRVKDDVRGEKGKGSSVTTIDTSISTSTSSNPAFVSINANTTASSEPSLSTDNWAFGSNEMQLDTNESFSLLESLTSLTGSGFQSSANASSSMSSWDLDPDVPQEGT